MKTPSRINITEVGRVNARIPRGTWTKKDTLMRGRMRFCIVFFSLAALVLIGRTAQLALFAPPELPPEKTAPRAQRAQIIDRNGAVLAMNRPVFRVILDARDIWDVDIALDVLDAHIEGFNGPATRARLKKTRWVELPQRLGAAARAHLFATGLAGVYFRSALERYYPYGRYGAHLIGYTQSGSGGMSGIESIIDSPDSIAGTNTEKPLRLTIDMRAQRILYDHLSEARASYHARAAWGVLLEARTGKLLAMVSLPDFDPNKLKAQSADGWRNRTLVDNYEPGSIMKVFTAAMAMSSGTMRTSTLFDLQKPLRLRGVTIKDPRPIGESLTPEQILVYSSNHGAARMALATAPEQHFERWRRFRLLEPVRSAFKEKRMPYYAGDWGDLHRATMAFGYGLALSPMNIALSFAAVINGGMYHDLRVLADEPDKAERIIDTAVSAEIRAILRKVITQGTGVRAESYIYKPIGKTGTAEKFANGAYKKNDNLVSFLSAFPGDSPAYVLLLGLDGPYKDAKASKAMMAADTVAPLSAAITNELGPVLHLLPHRGATTAFGGVSSSARKAADTP